MPQESIFKISGLYTSPNQFSSVPKGALQIADNIRIDRPNVGQTRRGLKRYGIDIADLLSTTGFVKSIYNFNEKLISLFNQTLLYDSDDQGTWQAYTGTFTPNTGFALRSMQANKNFYVNTNTGVKKLDTASNLTGFRSAGVVQALQGSYSLVTGSVIANDKNVAYRMVWGYTDANQNEIVGAPSQRLIASNSSGGTRDAQLTFQIPSGITTEYFYRIYRSGESASSAFPPNDELQLVLSGNPTSAEIAAGEFIVTDSQVNRGESLYTDPSQEGILQSNAQPPIAKDMVLWNGFSFYANTVSLASYISTLLTASELAYYTIGGATHTSATIDGLAHPATKVIQDLTYTSDASLYISNFITIAYTGGGTAGAEVVTVTGSAISVQIQSGVSTATQIKTAVDASVPASALISVAISGSGAAAQVTAAAVNLAGGFDTSVLNVGMKVEGTGIPANATIATIPTASSITITPAATGTASISVSFSDVFRITTSTGVQNYYAGATTNAVTHVFQVFTAGTDAENAEDTAKELIYVINRNTSNTEVYAYYLSGFDDVQGKFLIRNRSLFPNESAASHFTVYSSADAFFPSLLTTQNSDNQTKPHRIYISKYQQPEAVPVLQYVEAGSENFALKRILALRDCIFIIKEDGVFQITGTDPSNFNVTLFDATVRIAAPESAVVLNNKVFMDATQGAVTISINEINPQISDPIEQTLLELASDVFPNFPDITFGVAYDSDQKYLLSTIASEDDVQSTQTFVYDWSNNVWTRYPITVSAGCIAQRNGKLYMANTTEDDETYVLEERKNYTRLDYADLEFTRDLSAFSNFTITLDSTTNLEEGWTVKQGSKEALIVSIDSATVLTLNRDLLWEVDEVTIYQPIRTQIEFVPNTGNNPSILKQAREATFFFDDAAFEQVTSYFYTSFQGTTEVPISSARRGAWGQFPWGTLPWGGTVGGRQPLRTYIPAEQQWGMWLNVGLILEQAFQSFGLMGMSDVFQNMDTRFK